MSINPRNPAWTGLLVLMIPSAFMVPAQAQDAPAHGRPFFMPEQERTRIRQLIAAQE